MNKDEMKDRIARAEEIQRYTENRCEALEKENEELKKKNKELDRLLGVGTIFNKALNSMNKALEEERNKYRNMVFDQKDLLTKAKGIIKKFLDNVESYSIDNDVLVEAEQFLKDTETKIKEMQMRKGYVSNEQATYIERLEKENATWNLPNTCHTSIHNKKSNRQIGHIKLLENNDNKSFRFGILANDSLEHEPRFFTITNGELEILYWFLKIHENKERDRK